MSIIEEESNSKPPQQISKMLHKFAFAFKSKTLELFADDEDDYPSATSASVCGDDDGGFTVLVDEFIPDQKVVAIKKKSPDLPTFCPHNLISSIFSTISSFESSYLQLQTAHLPFDETQIESADKSLIQHLQRLSQLKRFYFSPVYDCSIIGSGLESEVQENQSKLRGLENAFNRLQSEIDEKGDKVSNLRDQLGKLKNYNAKLMKSSNVKVEIVMTIRVFDSLYREACRSLHQFTKVLISLMRKAEWDLELAGNSVYSDVNYAKKGHYQYVFLSFVSLCLFRGFDLERFGLALDDSSVLSDEKMKNVALKQLVEHLGCNTMEILSNSPTCDFSRFCETKYRELVNPSMESSIFVSFDQNGAVLNSWKSLSSFYESYVKMCSSIWLLHKLAFSFDPAVEIFQVDRGAEFSMVYMEDITKKGYLLGENRPKVGFTVIPGFKIGKTIIQSQVYLPGT